MSINILNYSCLPNDRYHNVFHLREDQTLIPVIDDEVLTVNEPMLKKAMTTLEFFSQDTQTRMEYEARLKFLRDEASRVEGAKAEGIAIGEAKGKDNMVRELLALGVDISIIAKASGLSEEEIKSVGFLSENTSRPQKSDTCLGLIFLCCLFSCFQDTEKTCSPPMVVQAYAFKLRRFLIFLKDRGIVSFCIS